MWDLIFTVIMGPETTYETVRQKFPGGWLSTQLDSCVGRETC